MPTPQAAPLLTEWRDYFLMTGTAAVTLLGLLFVALSFNMEVVLHETKTYLVSLSRQTFIGFVYVLFVSIIFLAPEGTVRTKAAVLVVFGFVLAFTGVRGLLAIRKHSDRSFGIRFLIIRNLGSLVCGLLFLLAGRLLMDGDLSGMTPLGSALMVILGVSAGSAWTLLIVVGRMKADITARASKADYPRGSRTPASSAPSDSEGLQK